MDNFVVYKHTNTINNKSYIGITKYGMNWRWNKHIETVKQGSPFHFHRAIRKYGTECWTHDVLFESFTEAYLDAAEIQLIQDWDTYNKGYNMTKGGSSRIGCTHSEYTKQKISKTKKEQKLTATEEHKAKISESLIGIVRSNQTRIRMSRAKGGRGVWFKDGYYNTVAELCRELKKNESVITGRLKSPNFLEYRYG